jgi:hypothetical protein
VVEIVKWPLLTPYEISIPEIWNVTAVVTALAVICIFEVVALYSSTCLRSINCVVFGATAEVAAKLVPPIFKVKVDVDASGLHTAMFVITAVVPVAGTVYKGAAVPEVVAAPRKSALVVVAISYYLQ